MPDFVFVARPGYMVARVHMEGGQAVVHGPGREFTNFMYIMAGEDTLPLFYISLNICLGNVRLHSVDFLSLWQQLLGQVSGRARKNA